MQLMFKSFEKILNNRLRKQNEKIEKFKTEKQMIQNLVAELKHSNLNMQQNLDDIEQYSRRLWLQIDVIFVKNNESVNSIFNDVKNYV